MSVASHVIFRLSMILVTGVGVTGAGIAGSLAAATPAALGPYYGRWSVTDENPVFTARGRAYKTIDIQPCGKDFCGVSVGDKGQCGPTLFRFLGSRAGGQDVLRGHGKWGDVKKNIVIYSYDNPPEDGGRMLELYLGDGYNFGERSGSMPKFNATYRRSKVASCRAK